MCFLKRCLPSRGKKCIFQTTIYLFKIEDVIQVFFCRNLFLLLSNGVLEIFTELNAYTSKPLRLSENSSSVHDFSLVRNNNELTVKLWVLYSEKVDSKVINYLGIYGGPCFSLEFSFQLPFYNKTGEPSYYRFSKNLGPYEEPTTIIEMAPDSVLMYHILETTTDVTLQKLLSRGKYLEAKDLALNYNKDLDIVRKAEARDKLNKLAATDPSDTKKIGIVSKAKEHSITNSLTIL